MVCVCYIIFGYDKNDIYINRGEIGKGGDSGTHGFLFNYVFNDNWLYLRMHSLSLSGSAAVALHILNLNFTI
jgi:hypothetical protein